VQRYIENMIKANFRRSILKRIFIKQKIVGPRVN